MCQAIAEIFVLRYVRPNAKFNHEQVSSMVHWNTLTMSLANIWLLFEWLKSVYTSWNICVLNTNIITFHCFTVIAFIPYIVRKIAVLFHNISYITPWMLSSYARVPIWYSWSIISAGVWKIAGEGNLFIWTMSSYLMYDASSRFSNCMFQSLGKYCMISISIYTLARIVCSYESVVSFSFCTTGWN